jgi:hypothetical protein
METPNETPLFEAPTIPSALPSLATNDVPAEAGDNATTKKNKRMNYHNWEIATIIYGCHAACVAKPQSAMQFRAKFLREHYEKFAQQCLR